MMAEQGNIGAIYKHTAQEDYHCIDEDPERLPGRHVNDNGYLLYFVGVML